MDRGQIEQIKKLITEQITPAIAEAKEQMMAAATILVEDVRLEVRRDHAENRTRFDKNYNIAAKAVAQNEMIMQRQDEIIESISANDKAKTDKLDKVTEMMMSIREQLAHKLGGDEAKSTIFKAGWAVAGTGAVVTAARWIYAHWLKL